MITLFVGRFQPFHKGHLHDIKKALDFSDSIVIGVGSSNQSNTSQNPFSFEERKEMIEKTLQKENIHNYTIVPIPDINDDKRWVDHALSITGEVDVVYTGNARVKRLFQEKNYDVQDVVLLPDVTATIIRRRMLKGADWAALVPASVAKAIHRIEGVNRIKRINGLKISEHHGPQI